MSSPAYSTTVNVGGTPTAIVDEPCTANSATVYQITNTAKRVLDPSVAVTVKANTVVQAASAYTLDPLFGTITFGSAPTAPVTISCSYLPMLAVAEAKEVSVSASADMSDSSVFNTAGFKSHLATLKDFSGSLGVLSRDAYDMGGGVTFLSALNGGLPVLIEIRPSGAGNYFRGWAILEKSEAKAGVAGLVEGTINFQGAARAIAGETEGVCFGWGT